MPGPRPPSCNKAGVDFGILGSQESCCGESIRKTGDEDVFKRLARENIKAFVDNGVKKILVSSPHCYHTFKNEYPEFMVHFEVVHITQYLLELIREGRLDSQRGVRPRRSPGTTPVTWGATTASTTSRGRSSSRCRASSSGEMPECGSDSLCCGGGGGRIWMETLRGSASATCGSTRPSTMGAEVLATACPYCITNFEDSRLTMGFEKLEVKDITEIIQEMI